MLIGLFLCLGCSGPGALTFDGQARLDRLTQLLSFETRAASVEPSVLDSLAWFQVVSAAMDRTGPSDAVLGLRRSLEQEADRRGLDILIKANYDAYEALEIFEHLEEDGGASAGVDRAAFLFRVLAASNPGAPRLTDRSDPSLPEPYKVIGLIHFKKGEAYLARGFFERALTLAPHSYDSDYLRSYLTQCIIMIEGEDL